MRAASAQICQPEPDLHVAELARVVAADAGRTANKVALQVHGGIGNTWECAAHVYLRRVLVSAGLWPVALKEISVGLS
mgnify:CR=1 FL=1